MTEAVDARSLLIMQSSSLGTDDIEGERDLCRREIWKGHEESAERLYYGSSHADHFL